MAGSIKEAQDQRNNNGTEDSPAMTIEFLRARLLSERSVSRAARQRADELAKRVMELEEQLKIVYLQRKKAEKATANVLAILENHGISDESEAFDSSSDQDGNDRGNGEETSDSIRVGDMPAYSSSEIEYSPSMGRSLSWKNSKHSLNSFEQNKFTDSARRKYSSSASYGSSPKRIGKSCRRIRRREIRSAVEGSQKDSSTFHHDAPTTSSEGLPNCHDVQPQILEEGSCHLKGKGDLEDPVTGVSSNQGQAAGSHFCSTNVGYEEMEGALENQEQLIGRYEAEEKAQREWEEKFTENKSCSPDLDDPENHSDVTEERVEVKETGHQCVAPATNSPIQDPKPEGAEVHSNKEVNMPNNFLLPPHVDISLQERESSTKIGDSSTALESEFPLYSEIDHQVQPENQNHTSPNHNQFAICSGVDNISQKSLSPGSRVQVALVPHETTGSVGSVLEALQKAKLSLKQKVDGSQLVESGSSKRVIESFTTGTKTGDRFGIPPQCPGLFRLPIDIQIETTSKASSFSGTSSRLNLSSYYPADSGEKFFPNLHMVPNASTATNDQFRTVSSSSVESTSRTHLDLHASKGLPFTSKLMYPSYPFLPDVTPQIPFNGGFPASLDNKDVGGLSTSRSSLHNGPNVSVPHQNRLSYYNDHTLGLPPSTQFSFYDHNITPNFR